MGTARLRQKILLLKRPFAGTSRPRPFEETRVVSPRSRGRFGELRIHNGLIVLHFLDFDCELKFLFSRTDPELQAVRVLDAVNRAEVSQSYRHADFSLWAFEFRLLSDQPI